MPKNDHVDLGQLQKLAVRVKKELVKSGLSVPTKLSEFTNDLEFQTKEEVEELIAKVNHLTRTVVDSIEDIDIEAEDADKYIYMVKQEKPGENEGDPPKIWYEEYWIIDDKLDPVGNTNIDLSGYVKVSDKASDEDVIAMLDEVFGPLPTPEEPPDQDDGSEEESGV